MPDQRSFGARPSVPFLCLPHLLEHQARRIPDAPAILAPGRTPLTYGRLYQHIEEMERRLRAMGIGRHDRIAIVLPNGPELAVAILTVAASAACVPLNPAYGADELERYFADLHPRALIVQAGCDCPSCRVALSQGIRVIELSTAAGLKAGLFTLAGEQGNAPSNEPVSASDTALLVPTSGTTARSKIVPQSHAGICTSAYAHGAALKLLDFLRAGMIILDGHLDRSDPTIELHWKILQAAASQRVDHWNWRHGATYLIAAEFRAVMYATSNAYGSEILSFVGWLLEHCPFSCRPELDAAMMHYPELSQCLRVKHEPLVIRAASVPVSSILTEKGEDPTGVICELANALAESDGVFNGLNQIGSFELREPVSADGLQFFRVIETIDDNSPRYRLELHQA